MQVRLLHPYPYILPNITPERERERQRNSNYEVTVMNYGAASYTYSEESEVIEAHREACNYLLQSQVRDLEYLKWAFQFTFKQFKLTSYAVTCVLYLLIQLFEFTKYNTIFVSSVIKLDRNNINFNVCFLIQSPSQNKCNANSFQLECT